mmetsp:Transcript_46684/g.92913  ORF Transcript_46684/g.92913 Transcript_46684/m.92913 type:complete len:99 (-) Transcript_46684:2336-2632(-)
MSVFVYPRLRAARYLNGREHTGSPNQRNTVRWLRETTGNIVQCVAGPTDEPTKEHQSAEVATLLNNERVYSLDNFQFNGTQRGSSCGSDEGGRGTGEC